MSVRWSYCILVVLGVVLTVDSTSADDDKKDGKGKGKGKDKKELRNHDNDDEFEKQYREQQKKYEEQRREAIKRHEEQRREGQKQNGEWQRKLEEQYREDQKRQNEWRKKNDKEGRQQFEEQLKRRMRGDERPGSLSNFGPVHMSPPPWPPFGDVPEQTRLPLARRAAAEFGPEFARALSGLRAGGRGFDLRGAQVAADLAQRLERLSELARQDVDLGVIRHEYAAVDAGWRQLAPHLYQTAREPETLELTWRLYLTERQLREAIGYAAHTAGPNWSTAHAIARDQTARLGQLVSKARQDGQIDINLVYDIRNAQREARAFEELVARRVRAEELQEQHDYLVTVLTRVTDQLQAVQPEAPLLALFQEILVVDRQLCAELGLPIYQDDLTREVIARCRELKMAADRLRRDLWTVLGASEKDVIAYYVQPSDQLATHVDLVYQVLSEGQSPELVRLG